MAVFHSKTTQRSTMLPTGLRAKSQAPSLSVREPNGERAPPDASFVQERTWQGIIAHIAELVIVQMDHNRMTAELQQANEYQNAFDSEKDLFSGGIDLKGYVHELGQSSQRAKEQIHQKTALIASYFSEAMGHVDMSSMESFQQQRKEATDMIKAQAEELKKTRHEISARMKQSIALKEECKSHYDDLDTKHRQLREDFDKVKQILLQGGKYTTSSRRTVLGGSNTVHGGATPFAPPFDSADDPLPSEQPASRTRDQPRDSSPVPGSTGYASQGAPKSAASEAKEPTRGSASQTTELGKAKEPTRGNTSKTTSKANEPAWGSASQTAVFGRKPLGWGDAPPPTAALPKTETSPWDQPTPSFAANRKSASSSRGPPATKASARPSWSSKASVPPPSPSGSNASWADDTVPSRQPSLARSTSSWDDPQPARPRTPARSSFAWGDSAPSSVPPRAPSWDREHSSSFVSQDRDVRPFRDSPRDREGRPPLPPRDRHYSRDRSRSRGSGPRERSELPPPVTELRSIPISTTAWGEKASVLTAVRPTNPGRGWGAPPPKAPTPSQNPSTSFAAFPTRSTGAVTALPPKPPAPAEDPPAPVFEEPPAPVLQEPPAVEPVPAAEPRSPSPAPAVEATSESLVPAPDPPSPTRAMSVADADFEILSGHSEEDTDVQAALTHAPQAEEVDTEMTEAPSAQSDVQVEPKLGTSDLEQEAPGEPEQQGAAIQVDDAPDVLPSPMAEEPTQVEPQIEPVVKEPSPASEAQQETPIEIDETPEVDPVAETPKPVVEDPTLAQEPQGNPDKEEPAEVPLESSIEANGAPSPAEPIQEEVQARPVIEASDAAQGAAEVNPIDVDETPLLAKAQPAQEAEAENSDLAQQASGSAEKASVEVDDATEMPPPPLPPSPDQQRTNNFPSSSSKDPRRSSFDRPSLQVPPAPIPTPVESQWEPFGAPKKYTPDVPFSPDLPRRVPSPGSPELGLSSSQRSSSRAGKKSSEICIDFRGLKSVSEADAKVIFTQSKFYGNERLKDGIHHVESKLNRFKLEMMEALEAVVSRKKSDSPDENPRKRSRVEAETLPEENREVAGAKADHTQCEVNLNQFKATCNESIQSFSRELVKLKQQVENRSDLASVQDKVHQLISDLNQHTSLLDSPTEFVRQLSPSLTPLIGQVCNKSIAAHLNEVKNQCAATSVKVEETERRLNEKVAAIEDIFDNQVRPTMKQLYDCLVGNPDGQPAKDEQMQTD